MTREAKHKNEEEQKAEYSKQLAFEDAPEKIVENTETQQTEESLSGEAQIAEDTEEVLSNEPLDSDELVKSVKASTHAKAKKHTKAMKLGVVQKRWQKVLALSFGIVALVMLVISGVASQYYKNKTMPGVSVANVSGAHTKAELSAKLEDRQKQFKLRFVSGEKKFQPKPEEIGLQINSKKTAEKTLKAKRNDGVLSRITFWKKVVVPVEYSINDNLLNQYLETNLPELKKAPQDSQLQFDAKQAVFVVTPQADGEGVNVQALKTQLTAATSMLKNIDVKVSVTKKGPAITEAKITPLLEPANALTQRKVVLSGLGYTFQAKPTDIASWITPTPQSDGTLKLVVDPAKVQSYVDAISKRISNAPVDRKVIKDQETGTEVVLQEGKQGTELADKQTLANSIADSVKSGQDTVQTMNITTAAFQTVNMEAYEKWIEVDLSEQRTTAYERTTPVKNFIIASGTKGHETVTGEYAIWLKVRSQTMQGGSKADGSYYSIPNVEWVSYFYKDYALHGAWWREKFGYPASHGCVNMTNADAKWVFDWAPVGTKVIVHQ